jgi:hypothetical protein
MTNLKVRVLPGSELEFPAVRLRSNTAHRRRTIRPLNVLVAILVMTLVLCWCGGVSSHSRFDPLDPEGMAKVLEIEINAVAEQIIKVESNGNPDAKNKFSSATGLGQFVNETWLILVRAHRPDLAKGRSEEEVLELRRDAHLAREITVRFTERNAGFLRKRGLPVTPGTLYLAHFAGSAGAVAILSAEDQADAATIMAKADTRRAVNREKLIRLNPFLERLTVADLKMWADRKMRARRA